MCLMVSTPVFAGNTQNSERVPADDIYRRLDFIGRKVVFESTKQLLDSLTLVSIVLKSIEVKIDFTQKLLISDQFERVLCQLKISNVEEQKMYDDLVRDIKLIRIPKVTKKLPPKHSAESSFNAPPTPRIKPKKLDCDIDEMFWLSSKGTEEALYISF